ncbi:glycoside hydrolase superfamily [Chytriomyces sp. MP71]|nr:glycoside hydrolase superfamily [Chytriomyces sp. MP71]
MNSNTGLTGQPICLSDFPLSLNSSAPTTSSSSPCYKFAKVVSPSSCVDIANAHNVSLASLATLNHGLQCNNLKFLDAICVAGPGTPSFAGANSYILHSFHPSTRDQTIKDLAMAGVKVVRIFLKRTWAGEKYGSDNLSMDDIENDHVGVYNDTMLNAIDELMFVASQHGIKLLLCMHDRYNLDATFDLDGYFNDFVEGGTLELFYSNPAAQSAFDKRLEHIVNHVNPLMGGRKWRDIPEGIYAFEIENEAQGEGKTSLNVYSNPQWWCQRATALRQGALKTSFIPISSGGGKDFSTSMRDEMFACDALDIITLHSYTGSLDEVSSSLSSAFQKAQEHKKMILYEEFGSASDKGGWLSQVGGVANSLHVPFMVWEVLQTASPPSNDFEFYTDNVNAWGALTSVAQAALKAI